VSWYNTSN